MTVRTCFIGGVRVVDNDRAVGYVEANGFVYLEKRVSSFEASLL